MENKLETLIAKKLIQKELLKEIVSVGLIDFVEGNNIIKKLEGDINKLDEIQKKDKNIKNLIVKIPI